MLQLFKSKLFIHLVLSFTVCALLITSARFLVRAYREIPNFVAMEKEADNKVVSRVNNALDLRTEQLIENYYPVSLWDELYHYALAPNPQFIADNFSYENWESSQVSALFIFDKDHNLLWSHKSKTLLNQSQSGGISSEQLDRIALEQTTIPYNSYSATGFASGIEAELSSPTIFTSFPIYNLSPTSQHSGFLVVWDFLSTEKLEYIQRYLQTDFAYEKIERGAPLNQVSNNSLSRDSNNMIHWSIYDHEGYPAYNVHLFLQERRFNADLVDLATLIELITAGVVFIILALLISRHIIIPLRVLQKNMVTIRETQDFSNRVEMERDDELGSLSREYNTLLQHIENQEQALRASNHELLQLSNLDALTGIANRRAFDDFIGNSELQHPVSLMMIDIDHFKRYNDFYGHPKGDKTLKTVAQALQGNIHIATDLAARYGGEEFAVVLTNTSSTQAYQVAQRILTTINQLGIVHEKSEHQIVSVSIGLCTVSQTTSPKQLIKAADQALYKAKERGRNQVQQYATSGL